MGTEKRCHKAPCKTGKTWRGVQILCVGDRDNASFEPNSRAGVLTAIDCLKANQSPGTDGCPAEWLKCCS